MDSFNSSNLLFLGTLFKMESINNNYMILLITIYTVLCFIFDSIDKESIREYIEKKSKNIIELFCPNQTVSIELVTHSVTISVGYSDKTTQKKIYSTNFLALLDYIKDIEISKKKEILTTQLKDTMYSNRWNDDSSDNRYQFIPLFNFNDDTLISKDHNIYLKMTNRTNFDDEGAKKDKTSTDLVATIYCYYENNNDKIKKIYILKDFLDKIKDNYIKKISQKDNKQYIYVYEKSEDIDEKTQLMYSEHLNEHNKSFDNVMIEDKDRLYKYIQKFKSNVDENILNNYHKMGIPYKAGILFWGSPGTGKTSTIKAILKETNRQGIIINLSNIESNKELETVFRNRKINNKTYEGNQICFILEDCDATKLSSIKERNNEHEQKISLVDNKTDDSISKEIKNIITMQQKGFDLSCFLNILDGIIELYGVMIIVTTNHPEKIDEALIRPGRIDFKYEFKKATKKTIIDMLFLKYDLINIDEFNIKYKDYLDKIIDYVLSPAEIQCILTQFDNIEETLNYIINKMHESNI